MKKIIILFLVIPFLNCGSKNEVKKPAKFINQQQMENILYDLAILQGVKSYKPEELAKNKINPKTYIYQKYNIDSLKLVQNNQYYAADLENYKLMFDNVVKRITAEKTVIDTLNMRESRAVTKRLVDSTKKANKKNKNQKGRILISG